MRMNGGQKAVVCVALGVIVVVLGFTARALWWDEPTGGWFNYAPNNGVVFSEDPTSDPNVLAQAGTWIGLVVAWAGVCLLVLRTRQQGAVEEPSDPEP